MDWEHPGAARFFARLAAIARVITFDKRGTGLSDRVATGALEERMDDIRAVMDAAGAGRAALLGISEGGPLSILFAATYPERTRALVLYGAYASAARAVGGRFGAPPAGEGAQAEHLRRTWGTPDPGFLAVYGPSAASDAAERAWWARHQRLSASPGAVLALMRMNAAIDVGHVLPAIRIPTLVLHRAGDRFIGVDQGRDLAGRIAGARFVELPGDDHLPWLGDVDRLTDAVAGFLAGAPPGPEADRVLVTLLCAAIGGPRAGDPAASDPATAPAPPDMLLRRELARHGGREVGQARGGLLATFDGPTRAVRCACAIRDTARALGLAARVGVHTGEVERRGERVAGLAVEVSARVAGLAGPGEVLVSSTVTDLVAGAGLRFTERGTCPLEGVPGRWRLFAAHEEGGTP